MESVLSGSSKRKNNKLINLIFLKVEKSTVELSAQAPSLLFITFYHPTICSLLSLEVQVKPNGIISAKINYPPDTKPSCSPEYVSNLLTKSCSIPLTLYYIIKRL